MEADSARLREDGVSVAEGNVVVRTPDRTITAHRMDYDAAEALAQASGDVTVRERQVYLEGRHLRANLETGESVLEDATFVHPDSSGRGSAERIEHNPRTTVITKGTFTTCEPGSSTWMLEASALEFDREAGVGTARNARLELLGVPVVYLPWLTFPLGSERKTGLLTPYFGTSDSAGTSLTQPFYLNLAPNFDATLRARFTSRRGEVLGGRFRYLTERSSGFFDAENLPEDRITGDSRSLVSFRHRHRIGPGLDARVEYARASDIHYLQDLAPGAAAAETDHLQRVAELTYELPGVRLETSVEDFQILRDPDIGREPYRLAPRLAAESRQRERNRRLNFDIAGEVTRFEHRSESFASGTRVHLHPSVSLPLRSSFGHLIPRATLWYTGYDLDDTSAGVADSPVRTVPSFSLDGGLYYEHESTFGNRGITQTLEPRLYYLWVDHRDQDHLPLFDTGSLTSGYDHMFRENRFSGADRIGDANRLTLAVDSRVLDGGREILAARLGWLQHFGNRRVRFCTTADPDADVYACPEGAAAEDPWDSSWIATLKARPHRSVTLAGALEHDGSTARNRRMALSLRYQPTPERIVNLGYRRFPTESTSVARVQESIEDSMESVSLSVHRDIGRHLRILGSANYALEEDVLTEVFTGIEYESCCWSLRVLGQRYLTSMQGARRPDGPSDYENSVVLQFELKGLSGSERRSGQWWTRPIPGYRNRF
ncbi:MAG: LPS-assembly protein LptD [Immundisolibacterales bacterium]|nr:LPS-assembly protein LptD [Immundisolibacterales bacterium]